MSHPLIGRLVAGEESAVLKAYEAFTIQPVTDTRLTENKEPFGCYETTLLGTESAEGVGTFERRRNALLQIGPSTVPGWWIHRTDLKEQLDVKVSVRNVWTSARNIVLRAGSPHNYLRMVEHIIALRLGLGVDNVRLSIAGGDPPLFDRSSLDLVEAIQKAKIVSTGRPARYVTVKEPVTIGGTRGDFVTLLPAEKGDKRLHLDVAIAWDTVIGQQRIQVDLTPETFIYGAGARTNATQSQYIFSKTIGKLLADVRNMGYTKDNILIHGKSGFVTTPRPEFDLGNGSSSEPVWHRTMLDLVAAIALVDRGRFIGTVKSYRAGHTLDVRLMTLLYMLDLLEIVE
ncbi:MAG: UDP-3-O-acyl-N-acetylglucosamine deacetylase [Kiritimatiellae bacterium]|nr:UDP-3-O-acyl-N-acetylglucosamine deacetylase [Kiritimatiellia bacterium]